MKIGVITDVKYHYQHYKIFGVYGLAQMRLRNSVDPFFKTMSVDKRYAYVLVDDNKITVRNLFDSKNEQGFGQKNTFNSDEGTNELELLDTNNKLFDYINTGLIDKCKLNENDIKVKGLLHFCVEYELLDGINDFMINMLVEVSKEKNLMEIYSNKIKNLEKKIEKLERKIFW